MSRPPSASGSTRQRVLDTAVELFGSRSVAGTSLQVISGEVGITKSAIYHHFPTRDDLLDAVLEPLLAELSRLVVDAEARPTPAARADRMLIGSVHLAITHRRLFPVLSGDPVVRAVIADHPSWADVVRRQMTLLADAGPGARGRVRATVVMAGIAAAVGVSDADLSDAALGEQLVAAGRDTLGLPSAGAEP